MTRIAVGVEYDGTGYSGWQTQPSAASIQDAVQRAFSAVADHPVALVCAGRTDAGVHAIEQVAHFDTRAARSERSWVLGANAQLPNDICILWAKPVAAEFHARYSALARTYRYVILCRSSRPALARKRVCWSYRPLEVGRMAEAAKFLVGEHDFSAFRASECQSRTTVRRMESLTVTASGEHIVLEVRANAFLHHMVRNIAGVLMRIGSGEARPEWAREVLESRDRTLGGVTAPAGGLYLVKIDYAAEYALPHVGSIPPEGYSESFMMSTISKNHLRSPDVLV